MNKYDEQVYDCYYDTAGNYHWTGVYSGKHIERGGRMNKYIEANAFKEWYAKNIIHDDAFDNLVDMQEAADVRENVHGEWIESIEEAITMHEYVNDLPPGKYKKYTCSECKYKTGNLAKEYNFCPHCGADMRSATTISNTKGG